MLTVESFETLAFPWFLFGRSGNELARGQGTLFQLPAPATTTECMQHYEACGAGWSRCPAGYAVYSQEVTLREKRKLVLPGLKINGVSTVAGKSSELSIKTDRRIVEECVARTLSALDKIDENFGSIVRSNIHEIRRINTNIYHASYASE